MRQVVAVSEVKRFVLGLGLVACGGPGPADEPGQTDTSSEPPARELQVDWAPSALLDAVWTASWAPPAAGEAVVEVLLDGVPERSATVSDGRFALVGAKAGRTYSARVVHAAPDGTQWVSPWAQLAVPTAPVPSLEVTVADEARMEPEQRWVLATVSGDPAHVVIWDRDGDPVWWRAAARDVFIGVIEASAGLDGTSVVHSEYTGPLEVGGLVRTALDGSSETFSAVPLAHHHFAELPSGGFGALTLSLGSADDGAGGTVPVQSSAIVEVAEGASADEAEHVVYDLLTDYVPPWPACSHVTDDLPGVWRWDHANSLVYDAERDAYWMMARNLDAILVIDRATGALLHQLGGREATIPLADPFDHGHFTWRAPGRLLVFDNRLHTGDGSRVVEYAVDLGAGTAEAVWSWAEPEARTMPALSDADALPAGNVLTTWTRLGTLREVAPDGTVVWEASTGGSATVFRAQPVGDPATGRLRPASAR
jgi:hypothetical protein